MALSAVRLGVAAIAAGGPHADLYVVPAGKRAIVRDVRVYCAAITAGAPPFIYVYVETPAGEFPTLLQMVPAAADGHVELVDAFIVLEAGDKLVLFPWFCSADAIASGHEFTLP